MHRCLPDFLITATVASIAPACTIYGPSLLELSPTEEQGTDAGTATEDACGEACSAPPEPTCTDKIKNGSETDVDCGGGACPVCGAQQGCAVSDRDCNQYTMCANGICVGVSCTDNVKDAHETDVDCGGGECAPCAVGKACAVSTDCDKSICDNGRCVLAASCAQVHAKNPNATDGIYQIDVDGAAGMIPPFPVYCDMTTANGGWSLVGFEPAGAGGIGVQGGLAYLGIEVGDPAMLANKKGVALFGSRFAGKYTELAVVWGTDYMRMTVGRDVFVNEVDLAIPVTNFVSSNATMSGWVTSVGSAIFCRASRSPTERPADTSWAVKPKDPMPQVACGCSGPQAADRGVFYGGGVPPITSCSMPSGGAFAGVKDNKQPKSGLKSTADLSLWVR
jgi:hypothetical protein